MTARYTDESVSTIFLPLLRHLTELQKEFAGYVWDDKAACDKPMKENDHLMDALRYLVRTMRVFKPAGRYVSPFGG